MPLTSNLFTIKCPSQQASLKYNMNLQQRLKKRYTSKYSKIKENEKKTAKDLNRYRWDAEQE